MKLIIDSLYHSGPFLIYLDMFLTIRAATVLLLKPCFSTNRAKNLTRFDPVIIYHFLLHRLYDIFLPAFFDGTTVLKVRDCKAVKQKNDHRVVIDAAENHELADAWRVISAHRLGMGPDGHDMKKKPLAQQSSENFLDDMALFGNVKCGVPPAFLISRSAAFVWVTVLHQLLLFQQESLSKSCWTSLGASVLQRASLVLTLKLYA